jgi:copper transporter 1
MLWNWYTIDACFLSTTWQVKSGQGFAGTCIAVVTLVLTLSALNKLGRIYDRYLAYKARRVDFVPSNEDFLVERNEKPYRDSEQSSSVDEGKHGEMMDTDVIAPVGQCSSVMKAPQSCCSSKPLPPPRPIVSTLDKFGAVTSSPRPRLQTRHSKPIRRTLTQQIIRSLIHTAQLAVAYFTMLLAMYFNGYIIISILIGAFLGEMLFGWDMAGVQDEE